MQSRAPDMTASGNARWIALIQLSRLLVQLLSLALLSRLLLPQDFGLAAMAVALTNLALLLRDMGTAAAVIQKPVLDERTVSTAFWGNMAAGLLLGVVIAVAAPLAATAMRTPELGRLLQVLALAFPISGLAVVHQALLERAGRFALLARIEIASAVAGLGVALLTAKAGAGAYSFAYQALTISGLSTALLLMLSRWRPGRSWSASEFRALWRFGGHVAGFNLVNYFARNVDSLIIGRLLGAASLGPYSLANRIMLFPLYNLTFIATRALFPVMSRVMSRGPQQLRELGNLYLRALAVIAFLSAPLMAGLFAVRESFVEVFLGARWRAVAELIAWLAPVGFVQSLISPSGSVFMALGRPDVLLKVGGIAALLQISAFAIGVRWGIVGVAQCYLLATLLSAMLWMAVALHLLQRNVRELWLVLYRPIAASVLMAGLLRWVYFHQQTSLPEFICLALIVAAGAVIYLATACLGMSDSFGDVLKILGARRSEPFNPPAIETRREGVSQ